MGQNTWSFPTWALLDTGPGTTRQTAGMLFNTGPGSQVGGAVPFSTEMTSIFGFYIRAGWTSQDDGNQGLFSIGVGSGVELVGHRFINSGTTPQLLVIYTNSDGTVRYKVNIGDEDGTNWLQNDKFYQFAISVNATRIQYACNGSLTPKVTVTTNVPGTLDINSPVAHRIWMTSPPATWGVAADPVGITTWWPSVVLTPAVHYSTAIDLTDSSVLGRIYDADGNFKNPGENGSLWLDDTYSNTIPDYFFPSGVPEFNLGSDAEPWQAWIGGNSTHPTAPGGLRKQYEL